MRQRNGVNGPTRTFIFHVRYTCSKLSLHRDGLLQGHDDAGLQSWTTLYGTRTVLAASSYVLQPSSVVELCNNSPARDDPRSQRPTHARVPREARARHKHVRGGLHGISGSRPTLPRRWTQGMCYRPLYRDVWITAIAWSRTSLDTQMAAICVCFQRRRVHHNANYVPYTQIRFDLYVWASLSIAMAFSR